jgi:hypothetical protein
MASGSLEEGARGALRVLGKADQAALVTFSDRAVLQVGWTSDWAELESPK